MNPNDLAQHLLALAAKGHAYDQSVIAAQLKAKDARIAELESNLKKFDSHVAEIQKQLEDLKASAPGVKGDG